MCQPVEQGRRDHRKEFINYLAVPAENASVLSSALKLEAIDVFILWNNFILYKFQRVSIGSFRHRRIYHPGCL